MDIKVLLIPIILIILLENEVFAEGGKKCGSDKEMQDAIKALIDDFEKYLLGVEKEGDLSKGGGGGGPPPCDQNKGGDGGQKPPEQPPQPPAGGDVSKPCVMPPQ